MSILRALARKKFASGGTPQVFNSDTRVQIPENTSGSLVPTTSSSTMPETGGRQYHPLADADYYTYGQGPEHEFFTGSLPVAPLQPNNLPAGSGGASTPGGGAAGVLGDIVQLAGAAKNAGALANMAGIDNQYTQAMQNPVGAVKDWYSGITGGPGSFANVASGAPANEAVASQIGYPSAIDTGLGAAGVGSTGLVGGGGEFAGAGATGSWGAASGAGSAAGSGASAAAPLGATAAGAAIIAAAAAGLYGAGQKANSLNKSAKNEQSRDSLLAYLSQRDSMPDNSGTYSGPAWLTPESPNQYGDSLQLPAGVTADQFRALPLDQQQKLASDWATSTGGNYLTGNVEGSSYDQSGGLKLDQRQQDIDKYGILSSGFQGPEYGSDEYNALMNSTVGPDYGHARGGPTFETGKPGVLAYTQDPKFNGTVRGRGTGRSDEIPARLSDGEYVMDAETVSMLGDGSTDAGAKKLDQMRAKLRAHKGKTLAKGKFSPNAKDPMEYIQ